MNGNCIKVYIVCHKPAFVPKSSCLYPIQVGAVLAEQRIPSMLYDDADDNISDRNKSFCELTAQYWAWKNEEADYYGFFHYRRYLNFSEHRYPQDAWQAVVEERLNDAAAEKYMLSDEAISNAIEGYDFILPEIRNVRKMPSGCKNVYEHYASGEGLHASDMDFVREIIGEKHPEYLESFDHVMNGAETFLCNMFVMKREYFFRYMEWLFDILFEYEKRADMSGYTVEGMRTPGHLAERLLTVFVDRLQKQEDVKIKYLQTVVFLQTDLGGSTDVDAVSEQRQSRIRSLGLMLKQHGLRYTIRYLRYRMRGR